MKGYEKQILDHNIKKFNLITRADLDIFFLAKTLIQTNQNIKLQINLINYIKKNYKRFEVVF